MNENISQYLFKYMSNPDPRYAVMLKGKWGCGKSFFIQKWIEQYKQKLIDGDVVLEPIYISLYGLKEPSQITIAIDRVLHPFFYSKGVEITKKILKIAGKIAFKSSFDWGDSDGDTKLSMESTLDSLSLLTSKDDDTDIGAKLIVFDDLERSLIDMKILLGYINNFVEHGACHVIIIGDETHTTEETKKILVEFKEKTVGREFEITPDMDEAIEYFICDDIPITDWFKKHKSIILDTFKLTECNNLRILRQCLYDFSVLYNEINNKLLEEGDSFMVSLLGSYIVTYCEYRGDFRDLLREWDWSYLNGISRDDDTKERINRLQSKYISLVDNYQIDVLNSRHIGEIINEIETGCSLREYVETSLSQIQGNTSLQDKLANFFYLSNDEFEKAYDELEQDVKNNNMPNLFMMGKSLALLVFFDEKQIHPIDKETVSLAKKHISDSYASLDNKESLYQQRDLFYQGVSSYGYFYNNSFGKDIADYATQQFEDRDRNLRNKMEEVLFNLDDENVKRLIELSNESTPDHRCCYNLTSIFKNVDSEVLSDRILKLKNISLHSLCHFLSQHYMFNCNLSLGTNRYCDDLPLLQHVYERMERELPNRDGVDGYMFNNLMRYMNGAIKRAQGYNEVININI